MSLPAPESRPAPGPQGAPRSWAGLERRRLGAGAVAAWLVGGHRVQAEQPPCALRELARLALDDTLGFLSVTAFVNAQPRRLMIDTGSNAGLIDPQAVAALGIATTHGVSIPLRGTGGTGVVDRIAQVPLRLGGLDLGVVALPVGRLPGLPGGDPPVVGFLGGDVLGRFDLDLDLPERRLSLWSVRAASLACAAPPAWRTPFDRVAFRLSEGRPVLQARLDGRPITALLDTGARSELLALSAARRLGVGVPALAGDPGGVTQGVDLRSHLYHWHRFGRLTVGDVIIERPVLTVAPLDEPFDMLLGTSWLRGRRVWLSYATRSLFIARAVPR